MNRDNASYLRIGLLLVGGAVLLVGLIAFLGGQRVSHGASFETYFSKSVQGLDVGAQVKYRGVALGRVTEIGLVNAEYGPTKPANGDASYQLVFVRGEIDRAKIGPAIDTAAAVKLGLRTRLAVQGLTGLSYMELDFVDPARFPAGEVPWSPKAELIPSMPSTLSQAQDAAQDILGKLGGVDFGAMAGSLQRLLDGLDRQIGNGDIQTAVRQVGSLLLTLET